MTAYLNRLHKTVQPVWYSGEYDRIFRVSKRCDVAFLSAAPLSGPETRIFLPVSAYYLIKAHTVIQADIAKKYWNIKHDRPRIGNPAFSERFFSRKQVRCIASRHLYSSGKAAGSRREIFSWKKSPVKNDVNSIPKKSAGKKRRKFYPEEICG